MNETTRGTTSSALPPVYIVILNWNGWRDTLECLGSLEHLDYVNFKAIVVDNGSTDDSEKYVSQTYPNVEIVQTGANIGFTGGNNVGIRHALKHGAEYVLLLNNDTIVDPAMLTELVGFMVEHPAVAYVGPKTYYANNPETIWFYGACVDRRTGWAYHSPANVRDGPAYEGDRETVYCPGSGLLMRASVLAEIGLLDDRFFLVHEDADWCIRARHAGYSGFVVGSARMWHRVSASFTRANSIPGSFYFVRNGLLLSQRLRVSGRLRRTLAFGCRFGLREPLRAIRHGQHGAWKQAIGTTAGMSAFVMAAYGEAPSWLSHRSAEPQ